ncbi:MAG: DUF3168 domain-containing protein [Bacteroidales bacterium]|nr:DUF3168 domain-containing protein [Candidatus Colicola equi]
MIELEISRVIYAALSASEEVRALVGLGSIYPVIAEQGATFPYLTYSRDITCQRASKDYADCECDLQISVEVYASDYLGSVAIAKAVTGALHDGILKCDGYDVAIHGCMLATAGEDYDDGGGCYIQSLTFNANMERN